MAKRFVAGCAVTLLLALPARAEDAQSGQPAGTEPPVATGPAAFIDAQREGQTRATNLIGKRVVNGAGDELGEIEDLLLDDEHRMTGVVLSVGGFLGVGEKYVATAMEQVQLGAADQPTTVQLSAEQLEAAPDFLTREEIDAAEQAAEVQRQQQEIMQEQQQPADQGRDTSPE